MTSSTDCVGRTRSRLRSRPRGLAIRIVVAVVVIVAIAMRVYRLNGQFDYDGYDEGVYWQTLRAMSAGYNLYGQIFCSQPPAFPLSIYPFYILFGSNIVAARLGVAALSLLGLAGAYVLGKVLAGRAGGVAALVVVVATPSYLQISQRLQAEGPATAFLFITIATALMWREHPSGPKGTWLAALCGVALLLGTLVKLLDITVVVPLLVIAFGRLWWVRRTAGFRVGTLLGPIACAAGVTALILSIVLVPFAGSLPALVQQVFTFHVAARGATAVSPWNHIHVLFQFLTRNPALSGGAAIGIIVSVLRRDSRIVPLISWMVVTFAALVIQVPLFPRHAVVLLPPLVAIAALAWDDRPLPHPGEQIVPVPMLSYSSARSVIVLAVILTGAPSDYQYYHLLGRQAESDDAQRARQIIADLQRTTMPDQWVITDAQFTVGLANRDTPPWLADTSSVRISSGYLSMPELIQAASDTRVQAVLFVTGRLSSVAVVGFHSWVMRHYRLFRNYGAGVELWTR